MTPAPLTLSERVARVLQAAKRPMAVAEIAEALAQTPGPVTLDQVRGALYRAPKKTLTRLARNCWVAGDHPRRSQAHECIRCHALYARPASKPPTYGHCTLTCLRKTQKESPQP